MSVVNDCAANADLRQNNMVRKVAIPRRSTGGCREHAETEIACPSEGEDPGDLSSEPGENAEQECDSELEELATRTLLEVKAESERRNSSAQVGFAFVDRAATDMVVDDCSGQNDGDRTNDMRNRGGDYKTKDTYNTNSMQLSSSLQSDFDIGDLYVNTDPYKHPALRKKTGGFFKS
ncbi:hypothetical protein NP493_7535g00002 [Ridgeia piscesae]|uniref:Uncharacterized protein n=1 Tax=Ridgeia piscesae TaxID=27915 RepID=A0AAD9IPZ2_RIDPI|nr:hypothetical protein NP493_7535g00002 [Ridgeia piscesae]